MSKSELNKRDDDSFLDGDEPLVTKKRGFLAKHKLPLAIVGESLQKD